LTSVAARVLAQDLASYPEEQVLGALVRCRRELKSRITLAAILERLEDGRPGPEDAWAIVARALSDESCTIVWSEEMRVAFDGLSFINDKVAARLAFKERYLRLVEQARRQGEAPRWSISLGHDPGGREGPIRAALQKGWLRLEDVHELLPAPQTTGAIVPMIRKQP